MQSNIIRWGVRLLVIVGLLSSIVCFFGFFVWLVFPTGIPPPKYTGLAPEQILMRYFAIGYLVIMGIVTFTISFGLKKRHNWSRVLALTLSSMPFLGVLLSMFPSIVPYEFSSLLSFTGISFPALYFFVLPFLGVVGPLYTDIVTNALRILLGILNLAILFFLSNKKVKILFMKPRIENAEAVAV